MSAETSPLLRPSALASMLISRFRSRRLIWFGPVDGVHVAPPGDSRTMRGAAVGGRPRPAAGAAGRRRRRGCRAPGARSRRSSRRRWRASCPPWCRPPACAACVASALTLRPRSEAASRLTSIATVGLSGLSVLSRSTRPGICCSCAVMPRDSRSSSARSVPWIENCRLLPPPRSVWPMLVTVMPGMRASRSRSGTASLVDAALRGPCGRPGARRPCRRSCRRRSRC